jgi:hypothetical protein
VDRGPAAEGASGGAPDLAEGLAQTRFLLVEQAGRTIPVPFLVVLVFWLMAITASLTLLAPRNGTLIVINVICASRSAARSS